ncbi:MAG TPA: SDR family oxidoreductase [Polyangiaceae bacterium]|jgi:NAD(P)-dependent dehydrogenase (short-subunit alcohol dehydrogenase family)|nr:SDR family oxidoreductase [Polyangiaceae bacterium]
MLLENKNAVIYGAGGVGSAVARAFAREGARLFLASRTRDTVEALAGAIASAGGEAEAAAVDATDEGAVEAHMAGVAERAGRIDVLFNAIGLDDVQGMPLVEMPLHDFLRPIDRAARTHFLTARAAARRMIPRGSGVIMTITAGPARRADGNVGGFDVANAAIEGMWRTLAAELGPHGVRLVVVGSCGSPDTPAVEKVTALHARARSEAPEAAPAGTAWSTLLGRSPRVAEVANAAVIMASDYASAMTGVIANVTCGLVVD